MAMMAMTTSSSINVNPVFKRFPGSMVKGAVFILSNVAKRSEHQWHNHNI
jgi:hypothetical protein